MRVETTKPATMLCAKDLGALGHKIIAKEARQDCLSSQACTFLTWDTEALATTAFLVSSPPPNNRCGIDPANKLWSRITPWASSDEGIAPV
eukprot:3385184-Amphidinium_carterae.1